MNEELQPSARIAAGSLQLAVGAGLGVVYAMTLAAPPGDADDAFFVSSFALFALAFVALPSVVLALGLLVQGARWAIACGIYSLVVAVTLLGIAGLMLLVDLSNPGAAFPTLFGLGLAYGLAGIVALATVHAHDRPAERANRGVA